MLWLGSAKGLQQATAIRTQEVTQRITITRREGSLSLILAHERTSALQQLAISHENLQTRNTRDEGLEHRGL